jgi:hypothetical protein
LRAYPARGIFSSASCTARCCSGRGSRGSRPRFDPRVVICAAPAPVDAGDRPAWVELALGPGRRGSASARRRELHDPMLGDLLRIVDKAEELAGKDEARACE